MFTGAFRYQLKHLSITPTCTPGKVGLECIKEKVEHKAMSKPEQASKPHSSGFLLQLLPEFLPRLPSVLDCDLAERAK